jgi:filamentous hemagglutinin family protein
MNTKYLFSILTAIGVILLSPIARAQTNQPSTRIPVADNSLGTQVSGTNNNFTITGGVNLGQNLLHSFTDFSVPTGGGATFDNSLGKQSIITRVTGRDFSDIDGLVNTQGANFFLINPNGIVFGKNVELNVGQTFVGTTANSIDLVDGAGNSVNFATNRSGDAGLLTINPSALFVNRLNVGGETSQISNFGTLQTNNPNQYIGLIGGNVSMNGGKINAPGGRVELGGLSVQGTVMLGVDVNNLRAQFPKNGLRGDVSLTNQARVNVAGAGGGDVVIDAQNVEILGGSVLRGGIETGFGISEAVAGDIKLYATGNIVVSNSGVVNVVRPNSKGKGGDITIEANSFSSQNGAQIGAVTFGQGNAGNVKVTAKNAVFLAGADISSTVEAGAIGQGGNITIDAGSLSLRDGVQLLTITRGASPTQPAGKGNAGNVTVQVTRDVDIAGRNNGFSSGIRSDVETGTENNGGNITIDAGSFSLRDGAKISATTSGQGNAGNVKVSTKKAVLLTGEQTTIFSTVEAGGVGKGGNIDINATSLSVGDSAQLGTFIRKASTTQPAGKGNAGNVNINVSGAVDITGKRFTFSSGIRSDVAIGAEGNGGRITINAGSFSLQDGAQIAASTSGQGNAGNVKITAQDDIFLSGNAYIFSNVQAGAIGQGGNIDITGGSLSLGDGAQLISGTSKASTISFADGVITLSSQAFPLQPAGQGDGGDVNIKVRDSINIAGSKNGFPSGIISSVDVGTKGNGGDVNIDAGSLSLQDGARLISNTFGQGNAGIIKINVTNNVTIAGKSSSFTSGLFVNSQSLTGTAGDIIVTSPKITLDSGSINATSASGNGGNIQIGGKLPVQSTSIQGNPIKPAETNLLSLRRGAQISTNASGTAQSGSNGGNITITAPNGFIVTAPNENSDITANAFSGSGGKVTIDTKQNFWISALSRPELESFLGTTVPAELNPSRLQTNNITAISQVNPDLNGQVSITPPEIDPSRGLSPLPNTVTDPTNQINPNCSAKAIANNSFTNVGRGGIPATPKAPLNEENIATNWVRIDPQDTRPVTPIAAAPAPTTQPLGSAQGKPIVEAQAWRRESNGDIVLVAAASGNLPRSPQPQAGCVDR